MVGSLSLITYLQLEGRHQTDLHLQLTVSRTLKIKASYTRDNKVSGQYEPPLTAVLFCNKNRTLVYATTNTYQNNSASKQDITKATVPIDTPEIILFLIPALSAMRSL